MNYIRLIGCILVFISSCYSAEAQVAINEVLASNGSGIEDEDGDTVPWIELYNKGKKSISLKGYGLSDDYDRPYRWVFPDITIAPEQFLLIRASGKDRRNTEGELHTNFRISVHGEEVLLTDPEEQRVDELSPTSMRTDVSFGRRPDGADDWYFFDNPTPGVSNQTEGYRELLAEPEFSRQPGFYTDRFDLELHHPDPDVTIYYTLDGSEPTEDSRVYSETITIRNRSNEPNEISEIPTSTETYWSPPEESVAKGTVVRAKAVKPGYLSGSPKTGSFFVRPKGDDSYNLPVVSLSTDKGHFFDDDTGIYVRGNTSRINYRMRGREWERPVHLEMFDDSGEIVMEQNAGVRIHGGFTRAFGQKSLRLYARNAYGDNRFRHSVFPELPYTDYNRLLLRNSGNDWVSTMFRDALAQSLIRDFNVDTQAYRPSIVFLNGEYWGIHNFRERYDRHYLERVYDIDPENIDLLTEGGKVKEGDDQHYRQMRTFIREHDLENPDHYHKARTMMDIDNFIDYYSAQVYYGNRDWPHNNIDYWRLRTPYDSTATKGRDGRWRWLLFDVDFSMGFQAGHEFDALNRLIDSDNWATSIFRNLLDNETFQNKFINRIADHLNTAFTPERVVHHIDSLAAPVESEIREHIARWNQPESYQAWLEDVEKMKTFARKRPEAMRRHLMENFNLEEQHELTVDVNEHSAGYVKVNSIPIEPHTPGISGDPWPWSGIYFEDIPVTLKAESWPGYQFSHWRGSARDSLSADLVLPLNKATSVTAVFETDPEAEQFPEPHLLGEKPYSFNEWPEDQRAATYPDHMGFVYMDQRDPELTAGVEDFTQGAYNLESRTRINGLGDHGFAFINTGNQEGNLGYPGTRLGGAILALNTQGTDSIFVSWQGRTVRPNSRVYNLRLQYRIGNEGAFRDVITPDGKPVEYQRHETAGHSEQIGPVMLPEAANNRPYIQLMWRYYYTGRRIDPDSGQRSKMAVSDINVNVNATPGGQPSEELTLYQNYPNPFNSSTTIEFEVPENSRVTLGIFDILGRHVATLVDQQNLSGYHQISWDAAESASGTYIYRLQTEENAEARQMLLLQ